MNNFVRPDVLSEELKVEVIKVVKEKEKEKSTPCPSYITQYYG